MPRMNILNKSEQEKFNTPPIFTSFERKQFFTLPKPLKEIAETLRTPSTRIGFLLACGYFKASKRFFKPNDYHKNDITFVINTLNLRSEYFIADHYLRGIRQYHQKVILEFYGYKKFDNQSIRFIKVEIAAMIQSQLRPKLIFWRCIDILIYNRIQIPTYFMISELILTALNQRKQELSAVIRQELSKETKTLLGVTL